MWHACVFPSNEDIPTTVVARTTVTLRLKLYRHYSGTSSAPIYPFPSRFFSLPLDWEIASPVFFYQNFSERSLHSPFSIPIFLVNRTNKYQQVDTRVHVFVTDVVPSFGEIQRKLESFARTTPDAGYHFAKQGNSFTYRFLKLISMVIPVVELLERRVGTCRFP